MNLGYKYLFGFLLISGVYLSPALAFDNFLVKKIQINGLKSVSKDVVLQEINFKLGQTITAEKAKEMIKSLYKTNFFQQIELERSGETLIIKLLERSFISKVNITGVKNKEAITKILKSAKISEGLVYDPNSIDKVEKEIKQYYLSQGNYGIHIESKVLKQSRNRVMVNLHITEGEEAKVAGITINGNNNFKKSILLKQLLHGKTNFMSWFTKNDRYLKEKLNEDLENLKTFYMNNGYINFQVDSTQVSLTTDHKKVYITINITEGEQYKLEKINLTGEFIVSEEKIQNIINSKIKTGDIFSLKLLLEIKKEIEEILADFGYIKAEARLDHTILEEQRAVNIDFNVIPNQRIMVRKLIITGNNLTEDFVIRRMLPQLEGTWVSNKDVQEGKDQILRYGYANKVDVINHFVPDQADLIDLEYKIEERRNMQLSAGINYSGAEGFGYELNADIKNFIGTGKDVGVSFNNTKVRTAYKFSYFNPYHTIDGIGFGYNLFYQRNHLSKNSKVTDYFTDTFGGDVNWSFPISNNSATFISFGYDKIKLHPPDNPPIEIANFVNKKGCNYKEYSATVGWRYNSLDRYIFPTNGFNHKLGFKYNLPFSDLKYYQINYESSWYKPLIKGFIFNFSSDLGYGKGFGGNPYPFFKNYFIGGADSLRGFDERTLGPKDSQNNPIGGNLLINFRSALILPVPFKPELESIVRPSIFMDAGQVFNTLDRNNKKDRGLRYSTGVSVAIHTPLGMPVVLSLAKPLNAKPGDQKETFSFTFSANY